jgi:hypothetical protein
MTTMDALLSHCIDYAGLFPPAGLDLRTTVENYGSYRTGVNAWALGRFILPAGRAGEFAAMWPLLVSEWPISLLLGEDVVTEFRQASESGFLCDVVECKPLPASEIAAVRRALPAATRVYFEAPGGCDPEESIVALAATGSMAKIRTGGITRDAVPSVPELAHFLSCCASYEVPFKATAGLHHPIRANHPLTYHPQSDRAVMHGYLNVLLASLLLRYDGTDSDASELLGDLSPANFRLDDEYVCWRDRTFSRRQIMQVRKELMVSFGSCSFTEPLNEIDSMRSRYEA